jgi:hypothetical protein
MNSPGARAGAGVVEWEDSAGEMESEDNHAFDAGVVGTGMMEVDLAADVLTPSSTLPRDADFFNSFPDDFDDQDLS